MGKEYVCERWPGLTVAKGGKELKFQDGVFRAADKDEERIIESAEGYGIWILDKPKQEKKK